MRKFVTVALFAVISLAFISLQGCDWDDTGSSSFNTARGAGVNVNFSGYYRPKSGDFIVGSNVTYFVLTQTGNSLEVFDNNNSYYTGSVGSPGIMTDPNSFSGAYPEGALLLQAQISFSGASGASGNQVQFVGIVRAVALSDIRGMVEQSVYSTAVQSNDSFAVSAPPVSFGDASQYSGEDGGASIRSYVINEGNTWYLLEGSWIEGGVALAALARAPAASGTFAIDGPSFSTTTGDSQVSGQPGGGTDINIDAPTDLDISTGSNTSLRAISPNLP